MFTYGWFMLRFDRKQQNSVKHWSFNLKKRIKKKERFTLHSWFQVTEINSSHLMQNSLVDYVVANLRHREIWGFAGLFINVSFFYPLSWHYYIFTEHFPLVASMILGAFQGSGSWIFESMSGSSTLHANLMRALLVHMPALGHLILKGKRKSEYLAQV